jgi:diguanylate cyclase (GGDEF)-like protein
VACAGPSRARTTEALMQRVIDLESAMAHAIARAEAAELDAAAAHDATRRQALHAQQLERLAYTDSLTGLPNRRAFMSRWEAALARSQRRQEAIGLMIIDADRFKAINDSAGHAMGDIVLRAISATLLMVARPPDVVGRLGGDEFAIFSVNTDEAHLEALADQIGTQFREVAQELGVDSGLSIGIVSSDRCPRATLFEEADSALYRSKDAGGDVARASDCRGGSESDPDELAA